MKDKLIDIMEVTHNLQDELNGIISIKLEKDDYREKVETILKDYRKKAQMPGFRPGKVPMGMVKKMYGKAVMAEEVNKILSEKLNKYIEEKELKVLGNPLPKENDSIEFDPVKYPELNFEFEIGLAPDFKLKMSEKDKFTKYKVKIDDKLIDKYIADLQKRYGKVSEVEKAGEEDMLHGKFVELDEEGNVKEGGIENQGTITLEFIDDEKLKKQLTGKKVGDSFKVDPAKVSKGEQDMAQMLGVESHEAAQIKSEFQFTVEKVYHMNSAEVNQDLFDQVFGEGEVKSEDDFREKVKGELEKMFERDADNLLQKNINDELIDRHEMEFPDTFLKKWIKEANEKPISEEQIEQEYPDYAKQLKWQLIRNKIAEEHKIEVKEEELMEFTKDLVKQQMAQYGIPEPEEEMVMQSAMKVLQDENQLRQVNDNLYAQKLFELFKDTFKIKDKEVDFDEFVKLATGKPAKKGILSNLTNMFS